MSSAHHTITLDQFARQAIPFSTAPGIRAEAALPLLVVARGA